MNFKKIKLGLKAFREIENWQDFFLDYAGMKKEDFILRTKKGKIKIRRGTNDKKIATELILNNPYFPKWFNLKEDPTIIDIGAHIGMFSVIAATKFPKSKIYSIEPSKDNYKLLLENVEMNELKNVKLFNMALSDKEGEFILYKSPNSARHSLVREEGVEKEIVKTDTMVNFLKNNIIDSCDMLKMDIEGAEYSLMYSIPDETYKIIDRIFFEIHDIEGESKEELLNFLKNKGYNIEKTGDNFIYAIRNKN